MNFPSRFSLELKGLVAAAILFTGSILLVASARAEGPSSKDGCAASILSTTDPQPEPLRLARAEEYLERIVKSGKPFTFDQAVEYVLLSLPEGEVKSDFTSRLHRNVVDPDLPVIERRGWRALFSPTRVTYRSRPLSFMRDAPSSPKRIYWRARVVKNSTEAMIQAFEAIRVVLEPDFKPIRTARIYFDRRDRSVREFLDSAQDLFSVQYDVYRSTKTFTDVTLPTRSAARIAFGTAKRIFSNFLWLKQYRTIRDLKLSPDIVDAIESPDPLAVKTMLRKRYGTELLVHWYVRHLRNVQNAAIVALTTILAPPLAEAAHHQYQLEILQRSQIDAASMNSAVEIVSGINDRTLAILRRRVEQTPSRAVQPSEARFYSDLAKVLENTIRTFPP